MPDNDDLVLTVANLASVRGRMDAVHSDSTIDGGGDGHQDQGGDGLNHPEQG